MIRTQKQVKKDIQTFDGIIVSLRKQLKYVELSRHEMTKQLTISLIVTPHFCFVCGTKLEEVGLGWLQCKSEKCGEVFLPFKDVDGNQNLMLQNTPFTPNGE
jgi:predicted nucleic acid-binding Zn ribbon protein